nr:MAG TPA: hypothetical protein [Caudoviricetes sp.]
MGVAFNPRNCYCLAYVSRRGDARMGQKINRRTQKRNRIP